MFWLCATIGALMPLLPIYLAEVGLAASDFAMIVAVQAATAMAIGQVIGYLADTRMRRTRLLLWMMLFGSLTMALFPLLPPTRPAMILGMVVIALFVSQRIMIFNALLLDSRRGEELYGKIRLVGSISFALTAIGVGILADMPVFGAAIMWPVLVAIDLFFAISLIRTRDEPPKRRTSPGEASIGFLEAQKILLSNRLLVRFLFFVFLVQFAATPGHLLQVNLMRELGASAKIATGALALAAFVEVIVFYYGAQIIRRFHLMLLFLLVPLALAVRWSLVALAPGVGVVLASNLLHVVTFGLLYLCSIIFLNREVPRRLKSSGQTMFGLVFAHLAMLLGNLWASVSLYWFTRGPMQLTEQQALQLNFGIGAGVAVLAAVSAIPMAREYHRRHGPGPLTRAAGVLRLPFRV